MFAGVPVYHFTIHAYRSWSPSHPRGYTESEKGYQPSNQEMADQYDSNAKQEKVTFDATIQEILILAAYDVCQRRKWRLHGIGTDPSHFHAVISWSVYIPWNDVMGKLKNILSLLISRALNQPGNRWFVVGGSRKRVKDEEHLNYLLKTYLPDHRGLFWREGNDLPEDRFGILSDM